MSENKAGVWASDGFARWLDARVPPANAVTLNQRKVFMLPSREGLYFALLLVFMLIAGINYQNSLVFAFAFLLASLFMVGMLHTYRNLAGLTLQAGTTRDAFAGEDAAFEVVLSRQGERRFESLALGWDKTLLADADLIEDTECRVRLFVPAQARGVLDPGRLLVETRYPLGLFRAWSWVDLSVSTLVYPRPIAAGQRPQGDSSAGEGELVTREGSDDFYGLREYNLGDPLKHIAWKSYARTDEMFVKQFAARVDRRVWIDWELFAGLDREARLSHMCHWVLVLAKSSDEYGLRLPGLTLQPARGDAHASEVLRALALFEVDAMDKTGGKR